MYYIDDIREGIEKMKNCTKFDPLTEKIYHSKSQENDDMMQGRSETEVTKRTVLDILNC